MSSDSQPCFGGPAAALNAPLFLCRVALPQPASGSPAAAQVRFCSPVPPTRGLKRRQASKPCLSYTLGKVSFSDLLTRASSDLQPGVFEREATYQKEESSTISLQAELEKPRMRDKATGGGQREINRRLELLLLLSLSFTRWNSVSLKEARKKSWFWIKPGNGCGKAVLNKILQCR